MRNRSTIRFVLGTAALLTAGACADLDVTNPNNPDIKRALASGEDVKNIAISTVNSWYLAATYLEPYMMLSVTADAGAANFGNFGMRFNNLEPRAPYVNNSAGGDRAVTESPWNFNYGTLGAANDVLIAIANGVEVPGGTTDKYKALAQFTQAASLANIAILFDKGFVVDETTTGATPEFKPYTEVSTAAMAKWDALISALNGKSETYDVADIPIAAGPLTSAMLARAANTMAARTMVYTARTPAENAAVNWAKVVSYAEKGLSGTSGAGAPYDFTVVGDNNNWYSYIAFYGDEPTWLRVDMRVINLMDPSSPAKFTGTIPPAATSADARLDSDFQFHGAVIGDPARGIYMQSPYSHKRYRFHARTSPSSATGPVPYVLQAENDLLWAEGLIRTNGNLATAASLINKTRVGRGNLPPATAADGAATLLNHIVYERSIDLLNSSGVELMDGRRYDKIQAGTIRHLPVPAKELEILRLPIYTFGGVGLPDKMVADAIVHAARNIDGIKSRVGAGRSAQIQR
ncbi:MAG: hypothetical protein IPF98_05690 [Gemmatimonadetes bacterium]|nr:hypothetical protein [Gemmatimonadota bacterium]